MKHFHPAMPHDAIREVLPNIYMVTGANTEKIKGYTCTMPRNMVIIKQGDELSLINSIRLTDDGLTELDKLGNVTHLISIGGVHGKDDPFYIDRYAPKTWRIKGMKGMSDYTADVDVVSGDELPIKDCKIEVIEIGSRQEGIVFLDQHGGVVILCDLFLAPCKNTRHMNLPIKVLFWYLGLIGDVSKKDLYTSNSLMFQNKLTEAHLEPLKTLSYKHLLCAHGEPLHGIAKEKMLVGIKKALA